MLSDKANSKQGDKVKLIDSMKACRRAGVPLVSIGTADPAGVTRACLSALNGKGASVPVVRWDIIRGAMGVNDPGRDWVQSIAGGQDSRMVTGNPAEFLGMLAGVSEGSMVVLLGFSAILQDPQSKLPCIQGVWNLRDVLKTAGSTVVLVGPVGWRLPGELKDDVVSFNDELPGDEELKTIASSLVNDAALPALDDSTLGRAIDAVSGLSGFAAEQALALSLSKTGLDLSGLWDRKRAMIEQTAGLGVWRGGESFKDLGGLDSVKQYFGREWAPDYRPRCVLFIDEIEKVLGGQGDTSGVSQGFLGTLLEWFVDTGATGSILLGHPGAGKSALAKAFGSEIGVPTVKFDLNGMKASLVGESEGRLRSALATVNAIARGRCLVLATSNGVDSIPPEMRSRFGLAWFFFDLLTADERAPVWALKLRKYGLSADSILPASDGWTGREIESCCRSAATFGISLTEAAAYVVPVCKAAPEKIEALRKYASGRFLSASSPGVYRYEVGAPASGGRRVNVE